MRLRSIIVFIASLGSLAATTARAEAVSSEERAQCFDILTAALKEESLSVRVHAAEAFIALHRPEPALKAFDPLRETTTAKDRILVWRVLARAEQDPAKQRAYVDQIREAVCDTQGPDQTHAMEALAKLDKPPASEAEQKRVRDMADEAGDDAPFALWRLANLNDDSAIARLAKLLEGHTAVTRFRAAYVLGRLRPGKADASKALATALATDTSPILRAAASAAGSVDVIRDPNTLPADRYLATMFLAESGTPGDIPLLKSLLGDKSSDLRIAAAYALLKIDAQRSTTHK